MSFLPAEQNAPHNPRLQQISNSRIRPCYRDRRASISSQPGILRAPASPGRLALQKRYTILPYTSPQATSTQTPPRTAIPRPTTGIAATNTIERSDIRILTDQFRSFSVDQPSLSIVEIGGRSLPLTKENLDRFLHGYGVWDSRIEELAEFEGPAKDRLIMRVVNWQDHVKLASMGSGLGSSFLEFGA